MFRYEHITMSEQDFVNGLMSSIKKGTNNYDTRSRLKGEVYFV